MRILILDAVPGRAPVEMKEGSRLLIAFRRLGYEAEIAGPGFKEALEVIRSPRDSISAC